MEKETETRWYHGLTIFCLLLVGTCAVTFWFLYHDWPLALSGTGATVGLILNALSARHSEKLSERILVVAGIAATFGFQLAAMMVQ